MKSGVVIVCAGEGRRFGRAKADFLLEGKPLFYYSLKVFLKVKKIEQIVLVLQKKHFEFAKKFIKSPKVCLAEGARLRAGSVAKGLEKIKDDLDYILIHDCARPFLDKQIVLELIKNLEIYPAVIPGLRIVDTLKDVEAGFVKKTLKRRDFYLIQTPQGFRASLIKKAYKKAEARATDSAQLLENLGHKVKVIQGSRINFKITHPQDICLARKLWKIIE